jgi:threonine dehydrogenase-like Zn-dependent dehydrogenase
MPTARAAVFVGPRQPLELREYPIPDPRPDEALIAITQTNICGSDLHLWRGDMAQMAAMPPVILGHEMTGRVAKLGTDLRTDSLGVPLQEGDRVAYVYYAPCERCRPCLRGHPNACLTGLLTVMRPCEEPPHLFGGFADYYVLGRRQKVFKVPDALADDEVAGANCALSQVIFGFERVGLALGELVVIQGAGGLGLYATAVAREMGAEKIIVIDAIRERLELARAMGADDTIDITEVTEPRQRTQRVLDLTGGWGADVVVEVVGFPEVVPEGIRMLARGGRYLEMGSIAPNRTYKEDPSILVGPNRSIAGVSLYTPFTLKKALDFLARCRHRYPFARVASRTFPLGEINEAFATADTFGQGRTGVTRVAIRPPATRHEG